MKSGRARPASGFLLQITCSPELRRFTTVEMCMSHVMFDRSHPHHTPYAASPAAASSVHSSSMAVPTGSSPEISPFAELLLNPTLESRRMNVAPGKVLYEPSTDARALFFVHRGQIRTYRLEGESHDVEIVDYH